MKKILLIIMLLQRSIFFSTETKFISNEGFKNIWLWNLSNTKVTQEKGIGLSYDTSKKYSTESLLWTGKKIGNNIYLGSAESAKILKINQNFEEKEIYTNSEKSMIGAIAEDKNGFLIGISPESELVHINKKHEFIKSTSLNNNYIWDIIRNPEGGFYILTGENAEIYEYTNGILSDPIHLEHEEHLLKGLYIDNTLWILAEKALYKKENNHFIAIASFEGTASSFIYVDHFFYIIQSLPIENEDKKKEEIVSSLISVDLSGKIEKLYSLPGFYFTSLAVFNNQIIVGADHFGLYVFYDLISKKNYYAALGEGKILEIFNFNNKLMLLTSDPSGLWTIDNKIAKEGSFTSEVYNTGNISEWGVFMPKISTPPNTSIDFFIQSGILEDPNYWSDWKSIKPGEKINVAQTQFIRYKAVLKSDGNMSPYVYSVLFPYTQVNQKPSIDFVNIEQKNREINVSWGASDPNKDNLEYDIYLAEDGFSNIKINTKPITSTNFSFPNDLFPSGNKRITLVASDRPSNSDKSALTDSFTSIPITFDSEPPIISEILVTKKQKKALISFSVKDKYSIIKEVSYTINGAETVLLMPNDGIFDEKYKEFSFSIPFDKRALFLQIHAIDNANNMSSKGITILK